MGNWLGEVEVRDGQWLALVGWEVGAFKVGVRDDWIGWTRERSFARLHLVANHVRFAVRPAGCRTWPRGRWAEPAAAVRGLPGGARVSGVAGGDVRRPVALRGDLLSGRELGSAGAYEGLCAGLRRLSTLAAARPAGGSMGMIRFCPIPCWVKAGKGLSSKIFILSCPAIQKPIFTEQWRVQKLIW